jgi:outer membrane receptor for ferrienterochelin and colicins
MKRTLCSLLSLLLASACLLTGTIAYADDAEATADTSELQGLLNENVVSTASKSAEVGTTAPATVTTVTAEDLRRYGIRTLAEAIDFLSLGAVTSDSQHTVDIGARGVMIPNDNGDHMLLLINGHTQNEPLFGRAHFGRGAAMPLEMIDHIEVILGPGSVLYGSNAMLGVINVVTKSAKDWQGGHAVAEVEPGKSWRGLVGAGVMFKTPLSKTPAELTTGVEYYKHDGPAFLYEYRYSGIDEANGRPFRFSRNGPENGFWGGLAKNAYYTRLPSAFARVVLGDFELNTGISSFDRAAPYRARYTKAFLDFDDPDSHERDRRLWLDLTHRAILSRVAKLTSRAYVDGWDWVLDINASSKSACLGAGDSTVNTCTIAARARTRWAGLELRAAFDWLENERFVSTVGVDGRLREMKNKADFFDLDTGRALQSSQAVLDRNDSLIGAYAQQTWLPTRWLSFNGGARFDKETRFEGVVSPRVAAAIRTWHGGTLKGSYAEAFRSPSYVETDYTSTIQLVPGRIVPEGVRSVEGSLEQKIGAQRLLFGVFRSWWQNMIENHVLSLEEQREAVGRGEALLNAFGVAQFRNVSRIDNWGLNATFEGTSGGAQELHYGLNATAAIARREEPGTPRVPLPVAPQLFGNARIAYDIPGEWPTLGLAAHYLAKRPIDRAYDGGWANGTYAPPQLEMRATISGSIPFVKGLSYRITGTYSIAERGPYVVGAEQVYEGIRFPNGAPAPTSPQLLPLDQLRTSIGLQYDLNP